MKKFYVGYHNKPWDMKDFTILCETENYYAATGMRDYLTKRLNYTAETSNKQKQRLTGTSVKE